MSTVFEALLILATALSGLAVIKLERKVNRNKRLGKIIERNSNPIRRTKSDKS